MKRLTAMVAALLIACSAFGAAIFQDNSELALTGIVDFFTHDGTYVATEVFYGYFVIDYLEIGPRVSFEYNGDRTAWALGLLAEYNFDTATEFIPFVGLSVDYVSAEDESTASAIFTEEGQVVQGEIDDAALVFGWEAGCKYFMKEDVALSAAFTFDWATEDIFVDGDDAQSVDAGIKLGIRFFF